MGEDDTLRDADLRATHRVVDPRGKHKECALALGESVTVGRSAAEADVVITDTFVSRKHLKVELGPSGLVVTDLSSNGTYLGQSRLPPQTPVDVAWGELLRLGRSTVTTDCDHAGVRAARLKAIDPPPLPSDEFELLGVLGSGGAGRVWAAFHKRLERLVAIKELHARQDEEDVQRFQREATVGSRLQSPFIVEPADRPGSALEVRDLLREVHDRVYPLHRKRLKSASDAHRH